MRLLKLLHINQVVELFKLYYSISLKQHKRLKAVVRFNSMMIF